MASQRKQKTTMSMIWWPMFATFRFAKQLLAISGGKEPHRTNAPPLKALVCKLILFRFPPDIPINDMMGQFREKRDPSHDGPLQIFH